MKVDILQVKTIVQSLTSPPPSHGSTPGHQTPETEIIVEAEVHQASQNSMNEDISIVSVDDIVPDTEQSNASNSVSSAASHPGSSRLIDQSNS